MTWAVSTVESDLRAQRSRPRLMLQLANGQLNVISRSTHLIPLSSPHLYGTQSCCTQYATVTRGVRRRPSLGRYFTLQKFSQSLERFWAAHERPTNVWKWPSTRGVADRTSEH